MAGLAGRGPEQRTQAVPESHHLYAEKVADRAARLVPQTRATRRDSVISTRVHLGGGRVADITNMLVGQTETVIITTAGADGTDPLELEFHREPFDDEDPTMGFRRAASAYPPVKDSDPRGRDLDSKAQRRRRSTLDRLISDMDS